MDLQAVARVIKQHMGADPSRITPLPTLFGGVCEVQVSGTTVIFKAALADLGASVGTEAWAYRQAAEVGVPVPAVIAVDLDRTIYAAPYVILERVPGEPLRALQLAPESLASLLSDAGQYLRRIHSIRVQGYGWLDEASFQATGSIRGKSGAWAGTLLQPLQRQLLPSVVQHGLLPAGSVKAIHQIVTAHAPLLRATRASRLLHGDFDSTHILVDAGQGRISGIIDFGDAMSGDPAWDLALFALREGDERLDLLLQGYGAPEPATDLPRRLMLYKLLRAIGWAISAHKRGAQEELRAALGTIHRTVERLACPRRKKP